MGKQVVYRVLQTIPLLLIVSFFSFMIIHMTPGGPGLLLENPTITLEDTLRIYSNLGLDQPLIIQYFNWVKNIFSGNLGVSFIDGEPVLDKILSRVPATLLLMGTSFIFGLILAIPIGIIAAVKKNSLFDYLIRFFTFLGIGIPDFWLALMLLLFFSNYLGWFPTGGIRSIGKEVKGVSYILDLLSHLFLPMIILTISNMVGKIRHMRSSMLEVIDADYMKTARAKGLSSKVIMYKHGLRNAILPLVTIMGLSIPSFLSGSVVVEKVFAWPGMGRMAVEAVFQRDYPVIMGLNLIGAILIIFGNLLADLGYILIDPRIRYE
ncbi:MAG: ABC transporter permease [Halanaerobiales bacterium]|nr:ABC transporter permease [Halanaerobiales bacterium]